MAINNSVKIHLLGADGTVNDSKYLIQANSENIYLDWGLFQGLEKLRLLNRNHLPLNDTNIAIVLLMHLHLDHTDLFLSVFDNTGEIL